MERKKNTGIPLHRYAFEQKRRITAFRCYDDWKYRWHLNAIRRCDRFVVLTHEDAKNWTEFDNVAIMPNINGFECEQSASLKNPVVVAVGRLVEQKGFDKLIEAWSIVCKRTEGWTLHIYGEGH